jgi:hypothetical protein
MGSEDYVKENENMRVFKLLIKNSGRMSGRLS